MVSNIPQPTSITSEAYTNDIAKTAPNQLLDDTTLSMFKTLFKENSNAAGNKDNTASRGLNNLKGSHYDTLVKNLLTKISVRADVAARPSSRERQDFKKDTNDVLEIVKQQMDQSSANQLLSAVAMRLGGSIQQLIRGQ
ncbi:MAG: hypothetical protein AAF228_05340 [Pseudomonadota bacterium]